MSASLRFPRPSGKTKTSPTVELRRAFAIPPSLSKHLQTVLDTAIRISGDMGNLQLYDPRSHSLRIVVQRGFGPAFLHFFDSTGEGQAACGRALLQRERVVVEDVANDPVFTDDDVRRAVLNAGPEPSTARPCSVAPAMRSAC